MDDLEAFNDRELRNTLEGPEHTRRAFLREVAKGVLAGTLSQAFVQRVHSALAQTGMPEELGHTSKAIEFSNTFRFELDPKEKLSILSGNFKHPDNAATLRCLRGVLPRASGKSDDELLYYSGSAESKEMCSGNIVVVGGPNSTWQTKALFGLKGPDDRTLERAEYAMPLVFAGMSSEEFVKREAPKAGKPPHLARMMRLDPPKAVRTWNWGIRDERTGNVHWIDGKRNPDGSYRTLPVEAEGAVQDLPEMANDYAVITKAPNILDPEFERKSHRNHEEWPHALVIEGFTGMATTSATELLQGEEETHAQLRTQIQKRIREWPAYQVLLGLGNVTVNQEGFHEARSIELLDVVPLSLGRETYLKAHRALKRRMEE